MIYRAIGVMSGSSLDGLDLVFAEFTEIGGKWSYEILAADCIEYDANWKLKLKEATNLSARDYQLLDVQFGAFVGAQINHFIQQFQLEHKVGLIACHGHTTFHMPEKRMTAQLGDGASIAAITKLPVVCNLRSMDVALGGQGAPIVPIGEKYLFADYSCCLNIGGIANLTFFEGEQISAFDACVANQVLNTLAQKMGKDYDEDGLFAAEGVVVNELFEKLNSLSYFSQAIPKSLSNDFSKEVILPIIAASNVSDKDALRTFVAHICHQIKKSLLIIYRGNNSMKLLVTGGGAMNVFLMKVLSEELIKENIEVVIPDLVTVKFKEALIMAFIGVKRWREEITVLAGATGASSGGIGGALWIGSVS
jgi:anhydro-N-acetylmuramic acid kinase